MNQIAPTSLARLDAAELERALVFATACAAITCGRRGADPPHRHEIDAKLIETIREDLPA